MALTHQQLTRLEGAITDYAFPSVYFDFLSNAHVPAADMRAVETAIREELVSATFDRVRDGLSNVIYWGYAQIGYRDVRVRRFRDHVSADQLARFQNLVQAGDRIGLRSIRALRLPEFSGIAFISKVLAFLDPARYCVLDKQLLKLAGTPGDRALHRVFARTRISVTRANEEAYDAWRTECAAISAQYFGGRYRVVDIERGFFQLVQADRIVEAQDIYSAA